MIGGNMVAIEQNIFNLLSDEGRNKVNRYIKFVYSEENATEKAINDALLGRDLTGPFNSIEGLMHDLDA